MAVSAVLKRFDRYFYYTNASGVLTPVIGTLACFGQGATLSDDNILLNQNQTSAPLHVYHKGTFNGTSQSPNSARVYAADGQYRDVSLWLNSDGTITIKNLGATYTFHANDRFLNFSAPLSAFQGPLGTNAITPSLLVTDSYGRAAFYVKAYRYDFTLLWEGGALARVFIDAEGSFVTR